MNEGYRLLTEDEIMEKLKSTPKINVECLLKQGYCEAKEFHHKLEYGER